MKSILFALIFVSTFIYQSCKCSPSENTYVYLVRHADKGGKDSLSYEGFKRAQQLAHLLNKTGIDKIYSTNYNRTKDTANPLATDLGQEVVIYDPRNLEAFANALKENDLGKKIVVVGHSNTTPSLTNLLLGLDKLNQIDEQEYDKLYLVILNPNCESQLLEMEYGQKSPI